MRRPTGSTSAPGGAIWCRMLGVVSFISQEPKSRAQAFFSILAPRARNPHVVIKILMYARLCPRVHRNPGAGPRRRLGTCDPKQRNNVQLGFYPRLRYPYSFDSGTGSYERLDWGTISLEVHMQMTAKADAFIALGLGLTNECNLACSFCYRDPARADRLSLDQVKSVMEGLPVRSVNLGTAENGMHPDDTTRLAYLRT